MGAYVKYGGYQHASGEVAVQIRRDGKKNSGGMISSFVETWVMQGFYQASTSAAVITGIAAIEAAYSIPNQPLGIYLDNGTVAHYLDPATSVSGVVITNPPGYPSSEGAELATFRSYSITAEAEFLDARVLYEDWTEEVQIAGGGPRIVHLECLEGLPDRQMPNQATIFRARQMGSATGLLSYPFPPPPIWPEAHQPSENDVTFILGERSGPPGNPRYSKFKTRWSFSFESRTPLIGFPTFWPQ